MNTERDICLIAISGGSGSGKSTLARSLEMVLSPDACVVIGEDHYYKSRIANNIVGLEASEVEALINFDDLSSKDMDLFEDHVRALAKGEAIDQPIYDFATHDRVEGQSSRIEPKRLTIIEGIHVLSVPSIADQFALKIYVDTPDDLRLARRILRDTAPESEGGRGRSVSRVISQYLGFVRPSHHRVTEPAKYVADLVIADEGLPAYGQANPSRAAVMRMLSPVLSWLTDAGVVADHEIGKIPDDISDWWK